MACSPRRLRCWRRPDEIGHVDAAIFANVEGDSEYPATVGPFEPVVIAEANDAAEHRQRAACLNSLTRLFRVADGLAQASPLILCVFAL